MAFIFDHDPAETSLHQNMGYMTERAEPTEVGDLYFNSQSWPQKEKILHPSASMLLSPQ
jgi:hypothetical protein